MSSRPTIEDVARLAGISTATVSRTLHFPDRVSAPTRAKVDAAIRATGYTLNAAAQSLRQRRTNTVLVVVPNIGNVFFGEVLAGIETVASAAGLTLLIGDTASDPARERAYIRQMLNGRADGAILLGQPIGAWFDPMPGGATLPIVSISESVAGRAIPHVGIDNRAAAYAAVAHLIAHGHRRIAHVTGPAGNILTDERIAGYRDAMTDIGIAEGFVVPGDFLAASGRSAAAHLMALPHRPTAVFCANDEMAMALTAMLHQHGLTVPRDMSVVGFDDIHFADTFIPALTTIHQPRRAMGEAAMRCLLAILDGQVPQTPVILPYTLIERASVATPPD
jgi:LacI family transcriptional regulator, repressor for deo operon, udp, cdd, tsx, nupC, and nupG